MSQDEDNRARLSLQIIVGALAGGVAIFLAICWFLLHQEPPREPAETTPLLSNVAAVMLVGGLVGRFVLRKVMSTLENGPRMFIVMGAAMIESGGLFGCVAFLLEGTILAFCVAVVSVPLILALQFPTEARWARLTQSTTADDSDFSDEFNTF